MKIFNKPMASLERSRLESLAVAYQLLQDVFDLCISQAKNRDYLKNYLSYSKKLASEQKEVFLKKSDIQGAEMLFKIISLAFPEGKLLVRSNLDAFHEVMFFINRNCVNELNSYDELNQIAFRHLASLAGRDFARYEYHYKIDGV